MKKLVLVVVLFVACQLSAQTTFSEKALAETMQDTDGNNITFSEIIKQYQGKPVFIDIWASWCSDCIKGMPKVKALEKTYGNKITFLYLSLDRSFEGWQKGMDRFQLQGEHYFIQKGWKESEFCTAINLDWIPRYMLVDSEGKITLFKAITADDETLTKQLKTIK